MIDSRPAQHLSAASKLYPKAWEHISAMRQARGKDLPEWPAWCFYPCRGFTLL